MRKILFRGKRLQGGEWVEGYFFKSDINKKERESGKATMIFTPDCDTFIMVPECHNSFMVVSDTVGQYTGLKDKNGKRIFEGDICRNTRTGEIVSVKWHGTMAGYVWDKRRADSFLFDFGELFRACDKYEVIGNIHDNKSLLNNQEAGE